MAKTADKHLIIGVDFDGTIVRHEYPDIGPPCLGAIDALKLFIKEGARIVLFTMRSDGGEHGDTLTQAVNFLKDNGVELWGINRNPTQDSWTSSPKAYCHVYIDDAAFGCPLREPCDGSRAYVDWPSVTGSILDKIRTYRDRPQ